MLETARLRLRRFTDDDLDALFLLRSDPEVMKYIGAGAPATREQVRSWLQARAAHWEQHNFGSWAIEHREQGKLIGWCGLGFLEQTPDVEVGYGLAKPYWGTGLASEAAAACLNYGFEKLGLKRIVAVAMPENTASRWVMEKLGMKFEKNAFHYGVDVVFYSISDEEYRRNSVP